MSCHEECMGCSECDPGPSGDDWRELLERVAKLERAWRLLQEYNE